jgi:hypothetical protein
MVERGASGARQEGYAVRAVTERFPGLMKQLAAAAEPCFDSADRLAVHCEMNLGALPHAVDELVSAVVRKDHPMPAGLIDGLKEWLADDPIGNDDFRQRLAQRIACVRTK